MSQSPAHDLLSLITPFRGALALIALCLAVYLPGVNTIPPLDRDEARYVQASKQMLETNDFIDIQYQDTDRHKKPIGIYWLQSASVSLFADDVTDISWYRAVSVTGAVLAVVATFFIGTYWLGAAPAFIGAALLAVSVGMISEAHMAKTDAMLLASIVIMQGALGRIYVATRSELTGRWEDMVTTPPGTLTVSIFWIALGVGILIKGPVAILVGGATVIALTLWDRSLAMATALRPWPLAIWTAVIVLPWFIAITAVTDGAFFSEFFGHDFAGKITEGQDGHGAPFGYHMLVVWAFFFPGAFFILPALARAISWRFDPVFRFLLAWIIPAWLIMEVMSTKLPHYTLPMYPALALLVGYVVVELITGHYSLSRWGRWIFASLWMLMATVLPVAILVLPQVYNGPLIWWTIPAALFALVLAAGVFRDYAAGAYGRGVIGSVVVMVISASVALGAIFPSLQSFHMARTLDTIIDTEIDADDLAIGLAGYHEPSAVFLLGTQTRLTDGAGAAQLLAEPGAGVVAVEAQQLEAFKTEAQALGLTWRTIEEFRGYNYSRGDWLEMSVITGWTR